MIGLTHSQVGGRAMESHSLRVPLQFRLLHVVGFLITLPVVAITRMLSDRVRAPHDESVFAETNRTVLTALGIAFMA